MLRKFSTLWPKACLIFHIRGHIRLHGRWPQTLRVVFSHRPTEKSQVLRPVIESKGGWVPLEQVKADANVVVAWRVSRSVFGGAPLVGGDVNMWVVGMKM